MTVGIVGLGLIGGSMAKSIKARTAHTVFGCDLDQETMMMARMCGAIDAPLTAENLKDCDLVLVAIRPAAAVKWVKEHAEGIRRGAILVDLCGVKRAAVLLGDRREFAHHRALHTAQVHKDRAPADSLRVLLHPFYRRGGTDGDQHKVAPLQIFRRQRRVDGAAHTRHHHGLLIKIAAEHGVRGARLDALGHRASDEAEADNADCHSLTPLSS